jgi:hypothetical protein
MCNLTRISALILVRNDEIMDSSSTIAEDLDQRLSSSQNAPIKLRLQIWSYLSNTLVVEALWECEEAESDDQYHIQHGKYLTRTPTLTLQVCGESRRLGL